jgi:hypothetical protein
VRIVLETVESEILPGYLREYRELPDGLGSFAAIEKETGQVAGRFSILKIFPFRSRAGERSHHEAVRDKSACSAVEHASSCAHR